MWDFLGRLVAEQKVDGMFAGYVGSSDPRRQSHRLSWFNRCANAHRQIVYITTRWPSDDRTPRYRCVENWVDCTRPALGSRAGCMRRLSRRSRRAKREELGVRGGNSQVMKLRRTGVDELNDNLTHLATEQPARKLTEEHLRGTHRHTHFASSLCWY